MKILAPKMGFGRLVLSFALAVGLANSLELARSETLNIGGTGSATPLIEQFARAYRQLKPEVAIRVLDPPMSSNASIRAVLAGAIDLAVPGKALTEEEKAKGGQDRELGRTLFLVVSSKPEAHPGFSFEQLAAVYGGKVTTWADGSPIRLVLRNSMESDTLVLRKLAPVMDQAVEAALARPGMLVAANDLENVELLEKTPGTLGTTNLALMQAQNRKLYPIPLNGVTPTLAALSQGSYPHSKSLYLTRGPQLSPAAQGFIDFILSASGREVLERAGYIPTVRQP